MNRAFSLVEVILAVSLIGLVILFLFGLLPSSAFMVRRAEQEISATAYAEEIVARLDSVSFETLSAAVGVLTPAAPGFLGANLQPRTLDDKTVLQPRVEMIKMPPADRLVQATVIISWTTGRKDHELRLVQRFSAVLR